MFVAFLSEGTCITRPSLGFVVSITSLGLTALFCNLPINGFAFPFIFRLVLFCNLPINCFTFPFIFRVVLD